MKRVPMWRRYARLFGADPRADTEDELSFHYEMRVRDYMRRGMDEASARAAAQDRLGDLEPVREKCAQIGETGLLEDRRREWFGELKQDLVYGLRLLIRSPLFTFIAVVTLALGIGATTAIFSVVNRVLLAPLPFPASEQLVHIWEVSPRGEDHNVVSSGNYMEWSAGARSFSSMGAVQGSYGVALTGEGEPAQLMATSVTPSAMIALGAAPLLGRSFTAADWEGSGDLVLLSHGLWQQRFGGDRSVVGRRITIDARPYTVIGVMRASFEFPNSSTELWLPLTAAQMDPTERRSHNYGVIARLRADVTVAQAQAELTGLARNLANTYPEFMRGWDVNVVPMKADLTANAKPLLIALLATVAVVLLIACSNLANLLLARAVGREREMAVRGALGAGRARIVRQLLTESLLIAIAGGALGILVASLASKFLVAAAPDSIPLLGQVSLNAPVLAFAGAITVLSTVLFGLAPGLRLARSNLQDTLRSRRGSTIRDTRLRGAILIAEVALSVTLLVGAGLLVRSFQQLQRIDLGYESEGLVALTVDLPRARYVSSPSHVAFYQQLAERARAIPGVRAVTVTSHAPAQGTASTFSFRIEGRTASNPSGREDPEVLHAVTDDYFRTLGIPLLQGRTFDARDRAGAAEVVIINESLARKHWPNGDAIGRRISFAQQNSPWLEIVGVVGDTRMESPDTEPVPALYRPHAQKPWNWLSWGTLIARVAPGLDASTARVRLQAVLWQLDDQIPVQSFDRVDDLYGQSITRRVFALQLIAAFALVALALSVLGLYGLMAFTVAEQKQEIGVRMALGAHASHIVRQVLARSLRLAMIGITLGVIASLFGTRLIATLLYEVRPTDPIALLGTTLLVAITAAGATVVPAIRAVRTTPLIALRG